jgi:hypothetical protein
MQTTQFPHAIEKEGWIATPPIVTPAELDDLAGCPALTLPQEGRGGRRNLL